MLSRRLCRRVYLTANRRESVKETEGKNNAHKPR